MAGQALRIDHGVLLTGDALEVARYAVQVAQRSRVRNGLPPSMGLDRLASALSAPGQADMPPEAAGDADRMTTDEAAGVLGFSTRQARRLAPSLGGVRVGGRWLLDRRAVLEHLEGMTL